MPISIACPSCSGKFKTPDNAAGRKVKCPKCGSPIDVPDPDNTGNTPAPAKTKGSQGRANPGDQDDTPENQGRPRRTVLYAAIGGGGLAAFLLAGVVILLLNRGRAKDDPIHGDRPIAQGSVPPSIKGNDPESGSGLAKKGDLKDTPLVPENGEVVRLTAEYLSGEFGRDEGGTNKRYKGKVLEITGVVKSVGKDVVTDPNKTLTCLYVGGDQGGSISCTLSAAKPAGEVDLLRSKVVTVRGAYSDVLAPALVGCAVLSSADLGRSSAPENQAENRKRERVELLAELEKKRTAALIPLEAEYRANAAEFEKLKGEEAALKRNPRFGDPFNKQVMGQYNALVQKQRDLARKVQETQAKLEAIGTEFEQEKRKILTKYSQPGDPQFVEYEGLLLTKEEVAEQEAFKREHGSPKTAAEKFMKAVEERGTISRPSYAGTFEDPQQKNVAIVAFTATVNTRSQAVHLFVYKKGGYWVVSNLPGGEENNLFLGPPPTGFKQVQDGPDGKKPAGPEGKDPIRQEITGTARGRLASPVPPVKTLRLVPDRRHT